MKAEIKISLNENLFDAARAGSCEAVKSCLSRANCDPLGRDSEGYSALMYAARLGHEDCVRLLLPHSDPLTRDAYGWSALMLAACNGHKECVKFLLSHSDASAVTKGGSTALMLAARYGYEDCVTLLLPVSDPLALKKNGQSASQIAGLNGEAALEELINVYALSLKEAELLTDVISQVPPRRASAKRM